MYKDGTGTVNFYSTSFLSNFAHENIGTMFYTVQGSVGLSKCWVTSTSDKVRGGIKSQSCPSAISASRGEDSRVREQEVLM